jgi:outer membrane protein TolC
MTYLRSAFSSLALALLAFSLQPFSPSAFAAAAAAPAAVEPPPVPDVLDLQTAVKYALEHNYSILEARERIKQQEGLIVEIGAQALPNATLDSGYNRNEPSVSGVFPIASNANWMIALNVRQALYAGGGISAAIDSSRLARAAALLDLRTTINNALLDVRTKFYSVLFTREQITVQEENIGLLTKQLQNVTDRFQAGTVSNFEVLTAKVQLANAQPPLITARNAFRLAIDQLRQSLGYSNTTPENLKKIPTFAGTLEVTPATYDLQQAIEAARTQRPELQRLATLEEADQAGVTIAQAGGRPTVALVGSYQYLQNLIPGAANQTLDGWTLGLQGSWAIFDGQATQGRVTQAKSQLEQARLTRLDQTLAIEVQVRAAHSSLQQAGELVDAAKQVVAQAEEAQRLAQARFAAGTATQLDELTADVALTQARNNELSADYNYNVALATLRTALGEADAYAPTE